MTRLPAIKKLADEVRGVGKRSPQKSALYLTGNREELKTYPSVDVLAMYSDPEYAPIGTSDADIKAARGLIHHLIRLRGAMIDALWTRRIFISVDVLDELIFFSARSDTVSDLILTCLTRIRDGRMNRPGLVIFPLHSFGVLGAGPLRSLMHGQLTIVNSGSGYGLFPQSNDLARTMQQLRAVADGLSINRELPLELIEHWHLTRSAHWLERNPILVVRVNQLPGLYYANEHLIMNRIQSVVGLLSLLAALQPKREDRAGFVFSSSRMNNWETLDLHHYLALFNSPARSRVLDGDCVPIHRGRTEVSELTALGFEIDPKYWGRNVRVSAELQGLWKNCMSPNFDRRSPEHGRTLALEP